MIISKRLEDAEFIMSKDELTYSAVIEDFKNASQIHILTYNISKDQNVLLKALKAVSYTHLMILILICLIIKNVYKAIDIIHFFQAGIIIMRIKIFRLLFTMN